MKRRERSAQAGFTLVELLVTITLLGLLTGFLAMGVRVIVRGFDTMHTALADLAAFEQSERVISRYLGEAHPALLSDEPTAAPRIDFEGDAERVAFRGILAPELGGWDVRFVLAIEETGADSALVMWVEGVTGMPELERFVLLPHVSALRLAYWGDPSGVAAPGWRDSWRNVRSLPELIQIFIEQRGQALPTMLVTLPIDTE